MAVHCKLSTLMGSKRFSIQDVHNQTGLSRNTISNLYNDKASRIDFDTADKLCRLFDCSMNDLFDLSTTEVSESSSAFIEEGDNQS